MSTQNAQPLKVLEGINNRLELYSDCVVIRRTNALSQFFPQLFGADKTITFNQIDSVHLHTSRFLTAAMINLVVAGSPDNSTSLTYNSKHFKLAHEIKEMIEDFKSRQEVVPHLKILPNKA